MWSLRAALLVVSLVLAGYGLPAPRDGRQSPEQFPVVTLPAPVAALAGSDAGLHTYRLGREVRPARPFRTPLRMTRTFEVPRGGAVFTTAIGALDGAVAVRISREGGELLASAAAPKGQWTDVRVVLGAPLAGPIRLVEEVTSTGGSYALSGDARLAPIARDGRPDVIVITLDTVRRDALTPFGAPPSATPVIAALASEATRFEQAMSVTSWTLPAHAALLTGRFPAMDLGFGSRVEPAQLTLAEVLAAEGYETHGMSGGPYTDSDFGFQQGFATYTDSTDWKNAERITAAATGWIGRGSGAPLFLFLNYFDAHEPFTGTTVGEYQALEAGSMRLDAAMLARLRSGYAADVRRIDTEIGRLFEAIRSHRSWRDTVVVVVADHGEIIGERGQIGHALTLDEPLIHIPLIVKAAARAPLAASRYREQIEIDDVFSLALELAGIDVGAARMMKNRIEAGEPIRLLTFSQLRHDPTPALLALPRWRSAAQRAVRTDTVKVVRDAEGRVTTYRIGGANGETLAPNDALTARLEGELRRFEAGSADTANATPLRLSPETLERLRALGYIR